jgi:hypothetical protein
MQARLLRRRGVATFAVLIVVAEVAGRSLTRHVDRALHVQPLANSGTSYYPFLLVGVKVVGALTLAALLARGLRAWATHDASHRLLTAAGHAPDGRKPRLRPGLSPRVWAGAFLSTSVLYLVHADVDYATAGHWASFEPWLHTYALPVFAVLALAVAMAWRLASWLYELEDFADRSLARARRVLAVVRRLVPRFARPTDDSGPRRRFGLAFESRPPPLSA